ncbi:unnamed protein product [Timema podura]|uniref:Uncharacterized protein n=1 Tax=Timema podura TaxID=61482 RepID=A0ABN7PCM7_TIMPD|nr:unnamed protein product [Timema podura]
MMAFLKSYLILQVMSEVDMHECPKISTACMEY